MAKDMPKFDNSYLIKGAIRQASSEAQKLHQFYYKLYYILFTFIQFIINLNCNLTLFYIVAIPYRLKFSVDDVKDNALKSKEK